MTTIDEYGSHVYNVTVTGFVADEGTIWLLHGELDGAEVIFACEPPMAVDILNAVDAGEEPVARVPTWAMWDLPEATTQSSNNH
jgi:hypothetical protein